jgi:hypothetical protein
MLDKTSLGIREAALASAQAVRHTQRYFDQH